MRSIAQWVMPTANNLKHKTGNVKTGNVKNSSCNAAGNWIEKGDISFEELRVNSAVVESHLAPPSDSRLLNNCVRVLSRHQEKSHSETGIKFRSTNKRKVYRHYRQRVPRCLTWAQDQFE